MDQEVKRKGADSIKRFFASIEERAGVDEGSRVAALGRSLGLMSPAGYSV